MGMYRVEVEATGGHGCQREVKAGGEVLGCQRMDCPDCITRAFVDKLRRKGNSVSKAVLTHWPGDPHSVVDDLLTKKRAGSF